MEKEIKEMCDYFGWEYKSEQANELKNFWLTAEKRGREYDKKRMVDRFLGWKLPSEFHPDAGISFQREYNVEYNARRGLPPAISEPVGTNLFDADQAEEMIDYITGDDKEKPTQP